MNANENTDVMLEIFSAIERRDFQRLLDFCQPDVEFVWPPSLPYAGGERGAWAQTWVPLQPTETERRMDPRPVLALYQLRDGKLARAQMFYFDTVGVAGFLAKARANTGAAPAA